MDDAKMLQAVEVPLPGGPFTLEFAWEGVSLSATLREVQRALIEKALAACDGRVTKAALLLGFKHHQSLISLISNQHPDLLSKRVPIRARRKPLITKNSKHKSMQKAVGDGDQWQREAL